MKTLKRLSVLLMSLVLVCTTVAFTGCGNKKKDKKASTDDKKEVVEDTDSLVVTVNDIEVKLDEAMYYIYDSEAQAQQNAQFMNMIYGQEDENYDYFSAEATDENDEPIKDESGKVLTNRDQLKLDIMDQIVMGQILYDQSKKAGNELSDEDLKDIEEEVDSAMNNFTDKQKKVMGLTNDSLSATFQKIALGNLYYDSLMEEVSKGIDEEAVKSTVNKEDSKKVSVEYIQAPTVAYNDEDGSIIEPDDPEKVKKEAKEKLEAVLEDAKSGKAFTEIAPEDEGDTEEAADPYELVEGEMDFQKGDQINGAEFEDAALTLDNNQVYDGVVEGSDGYYIIKMLNKENYEDYEDAQEEAVEEAKAEAFAKRYEEIKKEYTIKINDEVWDAIEVGELTYDESAEQSEDMIEAEDGEEIDMEGLEEEDTSYEDSDVDFEDVEEADDLNEDIDDTEEVEDVSDADDDTLEDEDSEDEYEEVELENAD
ncbi:MAG: peptidyl-prolyl cis-trans isomerase [Lachnospiraceae bacterium]|nr:peptidyl-prolyl cis-trans isomerase [Lachnospiraceae bacterium]